MEYIFWIVLGYLSGSVLFAGWLPKWLCGVDICAVSDDGNPGTFNVFQQCGAAMGILVLMLELGKAFLPVHMALEAVDARQWPFALVVAAPVLGHAFPVWNHFRGGKAIAASFGAMLGLYPGLLPVGMLAACYLIFSLILVINPHSMRSIVTFAVWAAGCRRLFGKTAVYAGCCLIALIVSGKHLEKYQGEKIRLELLKRKVRKE